MLYVKFLIMQVVGQQHRLIRSCPSHASETRLLLPAVGIQSQQWISFNIPTQPFINPHSYYPFDSSIFPAGAGTACHSYRLQEAAQSLLSFSALAAASNQASRAHISTTSLAFSLILIILILNSNSNSILINRF
jgi:hypothetical protein